MRKLTPFQEKALEYKKHISLTANAGSGKTYVLAKRYVEIALRENLSLRDIVAITFTEKAAGELNKKIAGEIDERIESEENPERKKILNRIRRQLVSANISTIHSFCIGILREFAPEAGLDAGFIPVDTSVSSELVELSVDEILSEKLYGDNPEDVKYLVRVLGSKPALTRQLVSMVYKRKTITELAATLYAGNDSEITTFFHDKFEEYFERLFPGVIDTLEGELRRINNAVLSNDSENGYALQIQPELKKLSETETTAGKIAILNGIKQVVTTSTGNIRSQKYFTKKMRESDPADTDTAEELFDRIKSFDFSPAYRKAEEELARFGKKLVTLFFEVLDRYEAKKKKNGYLDFDDMILFTIELIKKKDVREYLAEKYKYIMIDEYQDTDESQYNIFMPVLDNLQKGNLFVVGDEKQSIYMFRDAELKVFEKTKKEISTVSKEEGLLNLPHSFRVAPEIALFTNVLFRNLFADPVPEFNEVAHSDLLCARNRADKGSVEFLLADKEQETDEARLVVSRMIELVRSGELEFRDMAVLVRKRNSFRGLEEELTAKGIPYTVVAGKGFYHKQMIFDIYSYLSFMVDPGNDSALIGTLRSPFYTFSDAELLNISRSRGKTFYDKLKSYSEDTGLYGKTLERLKEHIEFSSVYDFATLIRKVLTSTGYYAIAASKQDSAQELANIEKLISIAVSFSQQGFRTLYDFVNYLAESIETAEDEGQAAVAGEDNTVKLMTVHQSKGLEFKAVFLYGCNDTTGTDAIKSKTVNIDKTFGILTKVPVSGNYFSDYESPPVNGLYDYITGRKNEAELKRLLYVAVTRAVDRLFISASHKAFKFKKGSFFELVVQGLSPNLSSGELILEEELEYMSGAEENFSVSSGLLELCITVNTEYGPETSLPEPPREVPEKPALKTEVLTDKPHGEIVSATKIAVFHQCPLKYRFTYEYGYSPILDMLKGNKPSFGREEDEKNEELPADVKGRVIHSVLEQETPPEQLAEKVKEIISAEKSRRIEGESPEAGTLELLEKYYASEIYRELKGYKNYRNEFEAYVQKNDFYLYGIIDKLVITDKKIKIVDYKTDELSGKKKSKKIKLYLPQLMFYTVLASRLWPGREVEVMLVFISSPDETYRQTVSPEEIKNFSASIDSSVESIRNGDYPPNYDHCNDCFYFTNGSCIKPGISSPDEII